MGNMNFGRIDKVNVTVHAINFSSSEAVKNDMHYEDDYVEPDYSNYEEISVEEETDKSDDQPWYVSLGATVVNFFIGTLEPGEAVIDATVQSTMELIVGVGQALDKDTSALEDWTGTFISSDLTGMLSDVALESWVEEEVSSSTVVAGAENVGTFAGYTGLSFLPGPWSTIVMSLSAKGSAAETTYLNGGSVGDAAITSNVAGAMGAITDLGLGKLKGIAKGAKSLKSVAGLSAAGAGTAASEPIVVSLTEYLTVGNDAVDENGNKIYKNVWDYYEKSGGLLNTVFAGILGAAGTGAEGIKGYKSTNLPKNNDLGNKIKYSSNTEKIKENFCLAYGLDYENDINARKMVNTIMNIIEEDKFTDENVRYLFHNLDKFKEINPRLAISTTEGSSVFFRGNDVLLMNVDSLDTSQVTLSHELGHMMFDTGKGKVETMWEPEFTEQNGKALQIARDNIAKNSSEVHKVMTNCSERQKNIFTETTQWYDGIKDAERVRISNAVDALYENNQLSEMRGMLSQGVKYGKVKAFLQSEGLDGIAVDDLILNKTAAKEVAIIKNDIDNLCAYACKLDGTYEYYGDYRKISSIVDSVSKGEYSSGNAWGHSRSYWEGRGDSLSYNEVLADYVSLSANGRTDALNQLEQLIGRELFQNIHDTLGEIAVKLK